jgi:hypothetical protein
VKNFRIFSPEGEMENAVLGESFDLVGEFTFEEFVQGSWCIPFGFSDGHGAETKMFHSTGQAFRYFRMGHEVGGTGQ